jgi:hypothetical protein
MGDEEEPVSLGDDEATTVEDSDISPEESESLAAPEESEPAPAPAPAVPTEPFQPCSSAIARALALAKACDDQAATITETYGFKVGDEFKDYNESMAKQGLVDEPAPELPVVKQTKPEKEKKEKKPKKEKKEKEDKKTKKAAGAPADYGGMAIGDLLKERAALNKKPSSEEIDAGLAAIKIGPGPPAAVKRSSRLT